MFTLAMPWYCLSSRPAVIQLTFNNTLNYSVGLDWHMVHPQCQRAQDHCRADMHLLLCPASPSRRAWATLFGFPVMSSALYRSERRPGPVVPASAEASSTQKQIDDGKVEPQVLSLWVKCVSSLGVTLFQNSLANVCWGVGGLHVFFSFHRTLLGNF